MVADVLTAMQTEEAAKIAAELEITRLQERAAASEVGQLLGHCPWVHPQGIGLGARENPQPRPKSCSVPNFTRTSAHASLKCAVSPFTSVLGVIFHGLMSNWKPNRLRVSSILTWLLGLIFKGSAEGSGQCFAK